MKTSQKVHHNFTDLQQATSFSAFATTQESHLTRNRLHRQSSCIKLQNISILLSTALRQFKQLNEVIKGKSEHLLTFSEAKSISSRPYAILTLQSDEFYDRKRTNQPVLLCRTLKLPTGNLSHPIEGLRQASAHRNFPVFIVFIRLHWSVWKNK